MKQFYLFLFLMFITIANATIINVPADVTTIQMGIIWSVDMDTVLVQPGTYVENINYSGKNITVCSLFLTTADTSYISTTIIDGNAAGSVVTFTGDENSTALLCGFTITNGLVSGSYPDNCGGGIYCYDSDPSLENLTITGNSASYAGGICCDSNSSPSLKNVTISGNTSSYAGGGIRCHNSSPSLENVTIIGNTAHNGAGGGIYCIDNSSPSLENVTISGNTAYNSAGGGIFCDHSSPSLENVTIIGNTAYNGGGIACYYNSSPSFENVTIAGNSASYAGGGIYCLEASPSLVNVTITGNSAINLGGGIFCDDSVPELRNSIMWNDSPEEIYIYSGFFLATYTDIQGGEAGIVNNNNGTVFCDDNIDDDPLFVDAGNGDYHLQSTSPCIDTGYPDQLFNDPDGTIADMGAFYYDQILNPLPPDAEFAADTTNGYHPLMVNFTDLSTQGTGLIDELYWEFGDGNNSSLQNPANEYLLPGIYTVSLTVTDINDSTDTETKVDYITVNPFPPDADFTADITDGEVPLTISFTDLSMPCTGVIDEWYWDFGDGNNSSLQNPSNEFLLPGIYAVSLTVTDVNDSTDTEIKVDYITVNPPAYSGHVWHISTAGSDVWGNGSEQYPFATIQHGIDTSSNTDTVLVQSGTYVENINYNGKLITVGSLFLTTAGTSYISTTIIDGNSSGSVVTFESGEDITALLTGFTIINGLGVSSYPDYYGGGITFKNGSNPSLQNVTITGNYADVGGGISCYNNCNPSLVNVTIIGNSASSGGGIHCDNSYPILINSILWNNSPEEIYINSGSVIATYSDIQGGYTGTGNINSDPLFVSPSNNNYNLTYASPCIDTGDPASPLNPDGSRADMGACYFDQSNGVPSITAIPDVPNDQGRYVIVTWERSFWDQAFSAVPIVNYNIWEKYPFELDRESTVTNDINKAILEHDAYFQREDTTWVNIANVSAMQWEEYSALAETFFDSTTVGDYLSYFFVSAHTPSPWQYFSSSVESGYSVDNIAPDETMVSVAQNGSNMNLTWEEVEYGSFQGNSYPEINGIWYKIYAGDTPDFICNEANLIDTITNLNYDYPIGGEEKKFFKIVVSDQP